MSISILRQAQVAGFDRLLSNRRADVADVALAELKALRDVDFIAPPEAAVTAEAAVAKFRPQPSAPDRLRCPPIGCSPDVHLSACSERVLATDVSAPSADELAVIKEERMRRALDAICSAKTLIRRHNAVEV